MKNIAIFISLLITGIIQGLSAQDLSINERKISFDDENYDSFVINVQDLSAAQESIEDYAKDKLGLKLKKDSKNVIMAEKVTLTGVNASKRCDFMVCFVEPTQVALTCRYGYDYIINSQDYPEEMRKFKQLVNDILLSYYTDGFNDQIEQKEKQMKDLQKEIDKNGRESKGLARDIEKNNKKMNKADAADKVEMENENITAQNRQEALAEINANLNNEINKLNSEINTIRNNISELTKRAASNVK